MQKRVNVAEGPAEQQPGSVHKEACASLKPCEGHRLLDRFTQNQFLNGVWEAWWRKSGTIPTKSAKYQENTQFSALSMCGWSLWINMPHQQWPSRSFHIRKHWNLIAFHIFNQSAEHLEYTLSNRKDNGNNDWKKASSCWENTLCV